MYGMVSEKNGFGFCINVTIAMMLGRWVNEQLPKRCVQQSSWCGEGWYKWRAIGFTMLAYMAVEYSMTWLESVYYEYHM